MTTHCTIVGAAFALASIGVAHADEFRPIEARIIDLGEVSAVAYYTVERESSPPSGKARPARRSASRPSSPRARASCSPPRASRVSQPMR